MKRYISHIHKRLSTPEYLKILMMRTLGNFLILFSVFLVVKTFTQPVYEELKYLKNQITGKRFVTADEDIEKLERDYQATSEKGLLSGVFKRQNVEILVPKDPKYSIIIPAIGANAKIVANVDPSSEEDYLSALKYGVAHAAGTAFPGEGGHIYLFAHSTDYIWNVGLYNAIFYLLYKLEIDDEIDLFYQNRRYRYAVFEKKIVTPDQVEYLTRQTEKELLTLQTCWPPGTTLQRLLVFARRVAE